LLLVLGLLLGPAPQGFGLGLGFMGAIGRAPRLFPAAAFVPGASGRLAEPPWRAGPVARTIEWPRRLGLLARRGTQGRGLGPKASHLALARRAR
jgi:hypothetical protein